MKQLKISTAGVRGIVGQGLNTDIALRFAQAFSTYIESGKIALGDDSRTSAALIRSAVVAGALACGSEIVDLGSIPSPSLRIYLPVIHADGAVIVGAGHNPVDWNALKFIRPDGMYLNSKQGQELLEIYHHAEFAKARWDEIRPVDHDSGAVAYHQGRLLESFDVDAIRSRRFTVAIDCCNGTCSFVSPALLQSLGCRVVAMNTNPARPFPHKPNPTPDNMSQLEALVKAAKADIGFAHDAEGERLGLVDGTGTAMTQEMTLAVSLLAGLKGGRTHGPVVTNLSTSMAVEEIAAKHKVRVHRTLIGQSFVAEKALQVGADLAGEGSGQVIFPWLHPGPDGIAVILFILEYLARSAEALEDLVRQVPEFHMVKQNISLPSPQLYRKIQEFRRAARKSGEGFTLDLTDGVRLQAENQWVHVRASSTESMLRIIAEAKDEKSAERLHRWARDLLLE